MFIVCYNGVFETIYSEYVLEVRLAELLEEGLKPSDIMVFDADSQLR